MDKEKIKDIEFVTEQSYEFNELTKDDSQRDKEKRKTESDSTNSSVTQTESSSQERENYIKDPEFIPSEKELRSIVYGESTQEQKLSTEEVGSKSVNWEGMMDEISDEEFSSSQEEELKILPTPEVSIREEEEPVDMKTKKFTVTFRTDDGEAMTSIFKSYLKLEDLKKRISTVFKISTTDIKLNYKGVEYEDSTVLSNLCCDDQESIEFGIQSRRHDLLAPGEFSRYRPVKDVKIVKIPRDIGGIDAVPVTIEDQCFVKEWLGGFRNKITKIEYHHAIVQTLPRNRPLDSLPQLTRETQTPIFPLKETCNDTNPSKATQMWRTDHYIPTVYDRIITTDPNRFIPHEKQSMYAIVQAVIKLQSYYRRHLKKRKIEEAKKVLENTMRIERELEVIRRTELLKGNEQLIIGSTFPQNRDDFYLLYLLVGKWWQENYQKVVERKTKASSKAAFSLLLKKEIELISVIERQRTEAKQEVLLKQSMFFIEACARPVVFRNNKGIMSSIDTLETQQAREYQEIISSFLNTNVSVEQRIDVLSTLKHLIKSYGYYDLSQEIIHLIERECDLLTIGVPGSEMKVLRERVLQLLLTALNNFTINPSAKKFNRPCKPKTDKKHYLCIHCRKLKQACDYDVHVKLPAFNLCASCEWMRNIGQERANITPFRRLLAHVRKSEMLTCCYSSVCYVLQPVGMCYLVRRIWGCKSILSEAKDLNDLRMVRFRKEEDWSPWNCILLTSEESAIHAKIDSVENFYSEALLDRIHWRHLRAKNHFLPLLLNDRFMQESGLWFNVQDTGKFLHPSHVNKFARMEDFEYIN